MKKLLPLWYVLAGAALLLIPIASYAAGLVPCTGINCDLCDVGQLVKNIIDYLIIFVVVPLSALMFAYAGILYFTSHGSAAKITRAHTIFKNVLIGFLIAISAWLVVNTFITVVFTDDFFDGKNWFVLKCVDGTTSRPGQPGRLINTNIGQLFKDFIPNVDAPEYTPPAIPVIVGYNSSGQPLMCPVGTAYDQKQQTCFPTGSGGSGGSGGGGGGGGGVAPIPVPVITPGPFPPPVTPSGPISAGDCRPNPVFGANANLMSCICGAESGGIASRPSGSDIMYNDPGRRAFSWGLYQINISVNKIYCPGQATLNCPAAFTGKNYSARVVNEVLYAACVAAAKRPECNTASALYLLNQTPSGAKNWSTYGKCVGR